MEFTYTVDRSPRSTRRYDNRPSISVEPDAGCVAAPPGVRFGGEGGRSAPGGEGCLRPSADMRIETTAPRRGTFALADLKESHAA